MNYTKFAKLFELVLNNFDGSEHLGKKASQKLFYFFERSGIPLDLRYSIHYYGPYSSKLDNIMHILESEDFINIDTRHITHIISIGTEHASEGVLTSNELQIANKVIKLFKHKTPMQLEALTTMDYVASCILENNGTDKDIIDKFIEIKGNKFDDNTIETTLKELKELNYIA